MTWSDLYLVCFVLGGSLSVLSLVGGAHLHLPFHLHFPHGWFHGAHGGAHADGGVSAFNFATIMAFLAWFGAMGYLLTRYYRWWSVLVLAAALAAGLVGGSLVYLFFVKVFSAHERPLRAADFDMIGVLGHLTVPIRAGGTGELVYSQAGTRRSCGARSEDGGPLPKGSEVVVLRYESGIAYVRALSDFDEDLQQFRNA